MVCDALGPYTRSLSHSGDPSVLAVDCHHGLSAQGCSVTPPPPPPPPLTWFRTPAEARSRGVALGAEVYDWNDKHHQATHTGNINWAVECSHPVRPGKVT